MNESKQMKHIFVVNPTAGKDNSTVEIAEKIERRKQTHGEDISLYVTKGVRDATEYVKSYAAAHPDETIRFYACGGDGTLNEVANGAVGFPNVEVGCYACGSGNDFVKVFGGKDVFMDFDRLVEGSAISIDLMKSNEHYAINATHFGFDTAVAKTMSEVKFKKFIGGKNAYTTGVVKALTTAMKNHCRVYADGEQLGGDVMLLCTVANGQYVGGSYRCAPRSHPDDGYLEVCYVRSVSIPVFIRLMGAYTRGEHLNDPRFKKYIEYRRAKEVRVEGVAGFAFSLDGEVICENCFTTKIVPGALRFVLPRDAAFIGTIAAAEN